MKKITIKFMALFAAVLLLNSCGEADPIIYDGEVFVSFTDGTMGDYFVQADNNPYPVQVGIPNPAGSDMTLNISVVYASGDAGTHYNLPSSVTIPAGEVITDLNVSGIFENMSGRKDTLIFKIEGDDVASFDNQYTLYLQQYCPFDIATFVGDWTANEHSFYEDLPYDPYTVTFEANPNGGDTLITSSIYPYIPFKVVFDASDPANFHWFIPEQHLMDHPDYGPMYVKSFTDGAFSSCDNVMGVLEYKVFVSAGNFEWANIQLVKD